MKALREDKQWSLARIGALFDGRSANTVFDILSRHKTRQEIVRAYHEHPDLAHEVEAQIRRITGLNIAHQVATRDRRQTAVCPAIPPLLCR